MKHFSVEFTLFLFSFQVCLHCYSSPNRIRQASKNRSARKASVSHRQHSKMAGAGEGGFDTVVVANVPMSVI
jgi:hypothetical protein